MIVPLRRHGVDNPYLEGYFAPVHEEVSATDLPVDGALTPGLEGRYLRIGNPLAPPQHVFVDRELS